MPGTRCAVAMCNNNIKDSKKAGMRLSFHTFPKDERRKVWILRCKRADKFNPGTSFICSAHFSKEDFEMNLQEQLLGIRTKRQLKPTAVPTINMLVKDDLTKPSTSAELTSREQRIIRKEQKSLVAHMLDELNMVSVTKTDQWPIIMEVSDSLLHESESSVDSVDTMSEPDLCLVTSNTTEDLNPEKPDKKDNFDADPLLKHSEVVSALKTLSEFLSSNKNATDSHFKSLTLLEDLASDNENHAETMRIYFKSNNSNLDSSESTDASQL